MTTNTVAAIEKIATEPDWYAPYKISQAIRAGGLIHMSGQAGIDADGHTVPGGFLAQGRQAFANLRQVLQAAGADLEHIVKVTILVTDLAANLKDVIALRGEFLREPYPADTLLEISRLAQPDWLIEIDAVALDPAGLR